MSFRYKDFLISFIPIKKIREHIKYLYGTFPKNYVSKSANVKKNSKLQLGEEIFIGDITPYDEKVKDKKKLGREAVLKFFEGAKNKDFFLNIIENFMCFST